MKSFTTSTILIFLTSIVLAFFLGRYSVSMSKADVATAAPKEDILTPKGGTEETDITSSTAEAPDSAAVTDTETTEAPIAEVEEEEEEIPAATPSPHATDAPSTSTFLARTKMGISDKKIGEVLSHIAENLEAKKLEYRSDLMQDCSGIFHQMKDSLQKRLPALAEGAFLYPPVSSFRNTRQIADWYFQKNNLLLVQDAVACKNSIRPGSVLFYGKSNKNFTNIDIDLLTDRKNNHTPNGAIMHIAVVTAVTTDKDGNVVDYTIMHGRNPRRHASRTGSKEVQSTRTPGLPPFGNWSQQLVAIANIATQK